MKTRKIWFGLAALILVVLVFAWPRPPGKVDVANLRYYVEELSTSNGPRWRGELRDFLRRKPLPNLGIKTPSERRARAAEAIRELGENARPATGAILPLLLNVETSANAMSALLGIGVTPEILPELRRAATNQSAMVRMHCVPLLATLVPQNPDAVSLVIGRLNDPDHNVRLLAVHALEDVRGDPTAAALPLVERLNDTNSNVIRDAAAVLSIYGNRATNALHALRKVLEAKSGDERMFIETLVLANMLSATPPAPYFRRSNSTRTNSSQQKIDYE